VSAAHGDCIDPWLPTAGCYCTRCRQAREIASLQSRLNDRLLSAAPDLLAACRLHDTYMAARYSGPHSEALHAVAAENWRVIRAAIAKADGK
jgi:hypothetical protein